MTRQTWCFESPGRWIFGPGAVEQLGDWSRRHGWNRVLIVTDPGIVNAGIVSRVERILRASDVNPVIYAGGKPEPTFALVADAVAAAHDAQPQAIIGLGGGSNLDLAKITAVVHSHGGDPRDYVGEDRVPGPVTPLVCVPTTAGTGSEVSASCVLTDEVQRLKVSPLSWWLRPKLAIVDPVLTLSCPPRVTADSGFDALVHAIEAYTVVENANFPVPDGAVSIYQGRNPISNGFAERAIRLIGAHLVTAYEQPDNLAARNGMALAASLAGMAFVNSGLALVHALEYPLGGLVHVSHGAGNGLFLPHVMRFNQAARERELAEISAWLGCDTAGLTINAAATVAIAKIVELQRRLAIPTRLRDLGVRRDQLPLLAEKTFTIKRLLRLNPRPAALGDIQAILEGAW